MRDRDGVRRSSCNIPPHLLHRARPHVAVAFLAVAGTHRWVAGEVPHAWPRSGRLHLYDLSRDGKLPAKAIDDTYFEIATALYEEEPFAELAEPDYDDEVGEAAYLDYLKRLKVDGTAPRPRD